MPHELPQTIIVSRAFVIRPDGHILMVRREPNDKHNAGLWEPAGGKVEKDETVEQALETEVREEVGLTVEKASELVHQFNYVIQDGSRAGRLYLVLTFAARLISGEVKLSHEHDAFRWLDYSALLDLDLTPGARAAAHALRPLLCGDRSD